MNLREMNDLIENKGYDPVSLAKRCGLDKSTIRNILNGRTKSLRGDTIKLIADALDVSFEELYRTIYGNDPNPLWAEIYKANYSISSFCAETGLSTSELYYLIRTKRQVRKSTVEIIANALGVSVKHAEEILGKE